MLGVVSLSVSIVILIGFISDYKKGVLNYEALELALLVSMIICFVLGFYTLRCS